MNDKKSIVMMGTPEFAVASLDALVNSGIKVKAVVTAPDRPAGRGKKLRSSAMSMRADELGIPTLKPTNLKDEGFLQELSGLKADLFVVVAFRMLPASIWKMPSMGTVNLHGSILPNYRGAAPINRAIMNGEKKTGATTFFIEHKIDTGDLIEHIELDIGPNETAGELHDRMKIAGAELLVRTVLAIFDGTVQTTPQHQMEPAELKSAPKIHTEDRRIDWAKEVKNVHDHIRGLSPYPGAWTLLDQNSSVRNFKILRSLIATEQFEAEPGSITINGRCLYVHCGIGTLEVLELQPEGKRALKVEDFLRGARFSDTDRFI